MESKTRWFDDVVRAVDRRERDLSELLRHAKFMIRTPGCPCAEAAPGCLSERSVEELVGMCREQMLLLCDTIMAGFDGATAIANTGVLLDITDNEGRAFGHNLQRDFMDYLVARELQ